MVAFFHLFVFIICCLLRFSSSMKSSEPEDNQISEEELKEQLDEIVSSVDTGARDTTSDAGKI